jgi:subtilisin family serine protease
MTPVLLALVLVAAIAAWPGGAEGATRSSAAAEAATPTATVADIRSTIERDGVAHVVVNLAGVEAITEGADGVDRLAGQVTAAQDALTAGLESAGADILVRRRFAAIPAIAITVESTAALDAILAQPSVLTIHADMAGTGSLASSVPFIGADQRHAAGNAGDGVTVAVIDSGADLDHPDLVDDILSDQACFGDNGGTINGVGFCPNGSDRQTGVGAAEDDAGHGTHVSGIVTSAGTVSSPGAAPGAEIIPIKVLDNCSFGGCFYFFSEILAALDWIIVNDASLGVDVINMSLGTNLGFPGDCDAAFPASAAAVVTLQALGVTTFASAGNNASTSMGAPACLSPVVAVGATDNADNVAFFSDSNASTDIFAPGVSVQSLAIGGGTTFASGTSMASPHAAGCAALLIESGDATTPAAIETLLESSTVQVSDNGLLFPRIDCNPLALCNGLPVTVDIGAGDTPTAGDDVILGTSGNDVVNAGGGNDTVCAGAGNDRVLGQGGNDVIFGGDGDDEIAGNAGNDMLYGQIGNDTVYGGSGNDTIIGAGGSDTLGGSSGVDTVEGGGGADLISGGSDADAAVSGGAGNDAVNGGGGDDTNVRGGDGNDTVSGNGGNDTINGDAGNDEVRGGPGNDIVNGNAGDDFVAGNTGNDTCNGGSGTDTAAGNCETVLNVP